MVGGKEIEYYYKSTKGWRIFIYESIPRPDYHATIVLVAGITGINHHREQKLIGLLSNQLHRVVVIHPRGTGYSEGPRGDISPFSDLIQDYIEIIKGDTDYRTKKHKILLFGHSMSTAIVLAIMAIMRDIDGVILVNPPYILKKVKGMSPSVGDYLKFIWCFLFARHKPVVNMAGNPDLIANEEDRQEALVRINDPLLVKYFSMAMMSETKKLLAGMLRHARDANVPLLLIYGLADSLVDQKSSDQLFAAWKSPLKQYNLIAKGTHGITTVILAQSILEQWIAAVERGTLRPGPVRQEIFCIQTPVYSDAE